MHVTDLIALIRFGDGKSSKRRSQQKGGKRIDDNESDDEMEQQ